MDQILLSLLSIQLRLAQLSLDQMTPAAEAAILLPADYFAYASSTAARLGVDPEKFTRTLGCESHWHPNAKGALGELGIAQIYQKYHPDVTDEQALDGIWSINWAAQKFAEGKEELWSCYNNIYRGAKKGSIEPVVSYNAAHFLYK